MAVDMLTSESDMTNSVENIHQSRVGLLRKLELYIQSIIKSCNQSEIPVVQVRITSKNDGFYFEN